MGAQLVQFPFMLLHSGFQPGSEPSGQSSVGNGLGQRLYKLADEWAYLGCRPEDETKLASLLGAPECTADAISCVVLNVKFEKLQSQLKELKGASLTRPESLAIIRAERTRDEGDRESNWMNSGSFRLKKGAHPSGYMATLCEPTWIRPDRSPIAELAPAPLPGQHTREVLGELKFQGDSAQELIDKGAVREGWDVLKHYLPL
jgi:crotonobetainyl-CoA:carnitine CoA-transferase CaiB-like acyl-CoA transferase